MTRDQETRRLIELAEKDQGKTPMLSAMLGLSKDLKRQRSDERRWRLFVAVVIATLILLAIGQRQTTNDIIAARSESRRGLCSVIQTQTDALAKAAHADSAEVAPYVADLNKGLASISCVITVPTTAPGG